MQEQVITLATPVFIALIVLEMILAWRRGEARFHFSDTLNSVGLGILSQVSAAWMKFLLIGIYAYVAQHFSLFKLPDTWWVWLAGLLAYDFLYYWLHRSGHEVAVLWAAHVVHHQSERYNLTTALRQTSSGPLLSWIFYLPLALLGVPLNVFIALSLIDLLYQFWVHTELIGKLGWFDRVFVSPSNHRVHHATNDIYLDKNYGGILILWDRLFGTFIEELDQHNVVYGTRSPLRSWNPIKANLEVYQAILRQSKHCSDWRDKLRLWIKHPGWQPLAVAQQFPHAEFILHRPHFEPALTTRWKWYCGLQFISIMLATTHFLAVHQQISALNAIGYGCWITVGLFTIGGLTEGNKKFLLLEAVRLITSAAVVLGTGQWLGEFALSTMLQAGIIGALVASSLSLLTLNKPDLNPLIE